MIYMTVCPHCQAVLHRDIEVFVQDGEVIGRSDCVTAVYADKFFEEDEMENLEDLLDQVEWERGEERRIWRAMGNG